MTLEPFPSGVAVRIPRLAAALPKADTVETNPNPAAARKPGVTSVATISAESPTSAAAPTAEMSLR